MTLSIFGNKVIFQLRYIHCFLNKTLLHTSKITVHYKHNFYIYWKTKIFVQLTLLHLLYSSGLELNLQCLQVCLLDEPTPLLLYNDLFVSCYCCLSTKSILSDISRPPLLSSGFHLHGISFSISSL